MNPELTKISETISDDLGGEQKWACMICKQLGKSVLESLTQCSAGFTTNGGKYLKRADHQEMIKIIKKEKDKIDRVRHTLHLLPL